MKYLLLSLFLYFGMFNVQKPFKDYTEELSDLALSFEMTAIQGGSFKMGSSPEDSMAEPDELPSHEVELDDFWISKLEVSWQLFEPFLNKNYETSISNAPLPPQVDAITRPSPPYLDMTFGMGKKNKPAVGMTQYGAKQFCKWLYAKTGKFYRLPTEAEWEYVATCGKEFKPQNNGEETAWHENNSQGQTHERGTKKPNEWGVYDLFGNVMEWTSDAFTGPYKKEKQINPINTSDQLYPRILRGGHFNSKASELRASNRFLSNPKWKQIDPQIPKSNWWFPEAPFVGIRLVRPEQTPSVQEIENYYNSPPIDDY